MSDHPVGTASGALLVGRLDLQRRLRDRSILLQVFLAPILLAVIVGGAFGGGFSGLQTTIVIADADQTPTSTAISAALAEGSEEDGVVFEPQAVTGEDEVAALVADDEEVGAAVLIPAGFTEAVQTGQAAELLVVGRSSDEVFASVAQSVADSIAATAQSRRVSTATAGATADQLAVPLDEESLAAALQQPPVIVVEDSRLDGTFNMMAFFAPGMAMIFLFFVMGAAARSLLTERRLGTLDRILAGPTQPTAVLLGKAMAVVVLGLLSLLTVYLVTTLAFGVDWGDPLGVLLVMLAAVIAIAGFSLIVTGIARTEQQAEALTIIGTLVFAVLGGTFVFTNAGLFADIRGFFPNGQALMAFLDLSAGQASWVEVLPRVLILLGMGLVTGMIGLLAIRRRMAR